VVRGGKGVGGVGAEGEGGEGGREWGGELPHVGTSVEGEGKEGGWEEAQLAVEGSTEGEVGEGGEVFHRMVEGVPKGEVGEGSREMVYWLVEQMPEYKVCNA
jgi:hypothetical protein